MTNTFLALNFPSNPGPGHYDDKTKMNTTGYYNVSKFSNSGSQKFSMDPREFLKISKSNLNKK